MSDISDLMARDPLSLTNSDIEKIIAEYRSRRAQFAAGAIKPTKASTTATAKKSLADSLNLDL